VVTAAMAKPATRATTSIQAPPSTG
jgi:hypothetical protein